MKIKVFFLVLFSTTLLFAGDDAIQRRTGVSGISSADATAAHALKLDKAGDTATGEILLSFTGARIKWADASVGGGGLAEMGWGEGATALYFGIWMGGGHTFLQDYFVTSNLATHWFSSLPLDIENTASPSLFRGGITSVGKRIQTTTPPATASGDDILTRDEGDARWHSIGGTDVPIADGGTGASTAAAAMLALLGRNFTAQDAEPSSPAADDLWYETDTNIMWFWDDTYGGWLSQNIFEATHYASNSAATGVQMYAAIDFHGALQYDLFLLDFGGTVLVLTTNDASNYWTISFNTLPATGGAGTIKASINTSGISAGSWLAVKSTVNAELDVNATNTIVGSIHQNKTLAPGNIYYGVKLTYRLIHP